MRHFIVDALATILLPMVVHAEGDIVAGEKAFTPCKACHAFGKKGFGSKLTGVFGRKSASEE
ncbi:c-type cytochrome [Methylobacterium sp. J-059]|uniref:c-type cytochrome n=1 Tax=Methylobacterium sp. J-059 TaxID=2836643 RepID=UPI00391B04CB